MLSTKQQQSMPNMLVNISSEKAVSLSNAAASNPLLLELGTLAQLQQSSSIKDQQSEVLFSGAVIQGRQFSITITITPQEKTGCGKDSASFLAVLINGVTILYKLFYKDYGILIFFNEIFTLAVFKPRLTHFLSMSRKCRHLQIRDVIYESFFKIIKYIYLSFKRTVFPSVN